MTDTDPDAPTLEDRQAELEARLSDAAQGVSVTHMSPGRLAFRRFRAHRMAMVSLVVLVGLAVVVFFPSLVTSHSADERLDGPEARMHEPTMGLLPPSWGEHPMGTDRNSRDMLARVLEGGQVSLQVGLGAAVFTGLIGTTVGLVAGYYGRWVDTLLMRIVDLVISLPFLVLVIVLSMFPQRGVQIEQLGDWGEASFWLGDRGSLRLVITVIALVSWTLIARMVRAEVLSLREQDYVEAARALGASNTRIMVRHLLPNAISVITVAVTLAVAAAVIAEAVLSFLGFGVDPTTPTWGNLMEDARSQVLTGNSHLVWFPGMMVVILVLSVNFIGDGLRDAFDPKQRLGADK